jgi:nucleotide-binding universal stress UspA family protein
MLQTILLSLDGSLLSELALPYAASIARRSGARVVLVEAALAQTLPGVDPSDAQVEVTGRAEDNLRRAASWLADGGIQAETCVYYDDPVHAILDAAKRHEAGLVVMSTHGRSGLGRMLYGSVADQILRRAPVPVLLVPTTVQRGWPIGQPLSVLAPLDGSEISEEALQAVDLLAAAFETKLTLLNVVQPLSYPIYGDGYANVPFDEEVEMAGARRYLQDQAERLRQRGHQADTHVAVGRPAEMITTFSRDQGIDVVVMATHGHGGFTRMLLGSVATSTLRQTPVPLLLVRPSTVVATPAATETEPATESVPRIDVPLSEEELELVERGLKALAYFPEHDYHRAPTIQELLHRIEATRRESGQPAPSAVPELAHPR